MARTMLPSRLGPYLLLLLCCLSYFSEARCPGHPYTQEECPVLAQGNGLVSPPHNQVLFGSSPLSTVKFTWKVTQCIWTFQRTFIFMSFDGVNFSTNETLTQAPDLTFETFMPAYDTPVLWAVLTECWSIRNGAPLPPGPGQPNTGLVTKAFQCWVGDNVGDRGDVCTRNFYYCKRQSDTVIQGPYNGAVFQQVNSIDFTWSDIAPAQSVCLTAATSFKYIFSIYNSSNIQTGSPLFTAEVPVGSTPKYTWTPNLPAGTYYWTVRSSRTVAAANSVTGVATTTTTQPASPLSFRLCGADIAPAAPTLVSPTNAQNIQSATYTTSPGVPQVAVTFNWSIGSFGLTCYAGTHIVTLYWSKDINFTTGVSSQSLQATTTSYSTNLADGTWYWKVVASNGALATTSVTKSFVVCALVPPASFATLTPPDNIQGVNFSSITFSWQSSSRQASCGGDTITYNLAIGSSPTSLVSNYTGGDTNFTRPFFKGTWYWAVKATDDNGQSWTTPPATFVTMESICVDETPAPGVILAPAFQYIAGVNPITVALSWTSPSLGLSCEGQHVPNFALEIGVEGGSTYLSQNLSISDTSFAVALPANSYTWSLKAYNPGQAVAAYTPGAFTVCDVSAATSFAESFSPANEFLDASNSLEQISWVFTNPQTTCLGGSMKYKLEISGVTNIFLSLPDQSVTSYDTSNFGPGAWTWTLSNDVSEIPIPGLPSTSYTQSFYICQPSIPGFPILSSPTRFSKIVADHATLAWVDPHNLTDSCTPYYTSSLMNERYTYSLFMSKTTTFPPEPTHSVSVYRDEAINFNHEVTDLTAGTHFWRIKVTKEVLIDSTVVNSLSQTSAASVFSICLNTPPTPPVLTYPVNGTTFERCNLTTTLEWEQLASSDFGVDCSDTPVNRLLIYLGTDPDDLEYFADVLPDQSSSEKFSMATFEPDTVYYWRVDVLNSNFNATSEIFTFTSPNTALIACSGHGTCNNMGTCNCFTGYTGTTCASVVPTTPQGTDSQNTNGGAEIGGIIGGVAGGLFLVVLAALVAFFILRKRAKKYLEKPVRPPPDFPPLAFAVPAGYPPLASEKIVPWYSFEQLLVTYGFAVPFAILDTTPPAELDEVVRCLVYIIESQGQGASFISALISKDLKEKKETNTLTSATLFRDNSHASKAFKTYSKIVGLPYIFYVFGDIVYEMCQNELTEPEDAMQRRKSAASSSGTMKSTKKNSEVELQQVIVRKSMTGQSSFLDAGSLEVDPNKMSEDDDVLSNAISLQLKCQKLLVKLFRSMDIFPVQLSNIFIHLVAEVQKNLNLEDGYNAVAAFVFLRLVNPAILFPHQYGLVDAPPNESLNRQLILITKVLQNLANGVHFGNKEQHMVPLNDFIDSNKPALRNFLNTIISEGATTPADASAAKDVKGDDDDFFKPLEVSRPIVETSLSVAYNQVYNNKERILQFLAKYRSTDDVKIISNKVTAITDALGEPVPPTSGTTRQRE